MDKHTQNELAEKYCLPSGLIPLFIETRHPIARSEYLKAVRSVCQSQIKWLLKRGWKPPAENLDGESKSEVKS